MADENKPDLGVDEDLFKGMTVPEEEDDEDSDAPLPGEFEENTCTTPLENNSEVKNYIEEDDASKIEIVDVDNNILVAQVDNTTIATPDIITTPSAAVAFDDEEVIVNTIEKENKQPLNSEEKKTATISDLLKVSDFNVEIINGDINLNKMSDVNMSPDHVELPNNTNLEYLGIVDPLTGQNILEKAIKEDRSIATYADKLASEIKSREDKGTHEREDTSKYYSSTVVDRGEGTRPIKLYPTFVPTKEAGNLSPLERLGEQISRATGSDVTISAELWNSGLWIGFKSPSEPEIIQLQLLAMDNEMKLGASTAGMVYSNYSVLYTRYALNLIFSNIVYSNVKVKDNSELLSLMKCTDINSLLNNLNASIYPSGVERMTTCKNFLRAVEPCTHTVLTKLHFDRLHYKDFSRITDSMILHMSNKNPNTVTVAEVLEYQKEIEKYNTKISTYTLPDNSKIKFTYSTPSIPEYLSQGDFWVSKIEAIVNDIITSSGKTASNISDSVMEVYMDSAMRTNLLGLYLHYIKAIEYGDAIETDYKKINNHLTTLTKTGNLADEIISDVLTLIKTSSLTIIGTTQYTCPTCKEINNNQTVDDGHEFKTIIPFNPLSVLFILGSLKYTTIIMRRG